MAEFLEPSSMQVDIYDSVSDGSQNIQTIAVAGSGKTSTAVEAAKLMHGKVVGISFNKHIADEMKLRFPAHVESMTCHSLALRIYKTAHRFVDVEPKKITNLARKYVDTLDFIPNKQKWLVVQQAEKSVGMVMNTLTDYNNQDALLSMFDQYGLDFNGNTDLMLDLTPQIMESAANIRNVINFDEMIYYVASDPARFKVPAYDWGIVDESQDLNAAQIELLLMILLNGHGLTVGDPNQSIYGFRGADYEAMNKMRDRLNAVMKPLSISYRCPQSHVDLARQFVPQMQAYHKNPVGEIIYTSIDKIIAERGIKPGMLVMCRTNAPLTKVAYQLIRSGIAAKVRGRDIGLSVINMINKVYVDGDSIEVFLMKLEIYYAEERMKMNARDASDNVIQALADRYETVAVLSDGCSTVQDLINAAENIFSDEDKAGVVMCSSVHRVKGLQAETSVIIKPSIMPMKTKTERDAQQERNIQYVAMTRATKTMIFAE